MLVPVSQVILQTAPLPTEVHAMYVPEILLRNPSLFCLHPPFEMKQERGVKSFHFLQFLPFVSMVWLPLPLMQLSPFFCSVYQLGFLTFGRK